MKSPEELAERRRRRQFRIVRDLLKEYTNELRTIIENLIDIGTSKNQTGASLKSRSYIKRCGSIIDSISDASLLGSQMIIHYDLDPAEKAELSIRVSDIDDAIVSAVAVAKTMAEEYGIENSISNIQEIFRKRDVAN